MTREEREMRGRDKNGADTAKKEEVKKGRNIKKENGRETKKEKKIGRGRKKKCKKGSKEGKKRKELLYCIELQLSNCYMPL